MSIPDWTAEGVIPPIDISSPTSPTRSPYVVPLSDVILRFGTSSSRREILDGFLRYRAALHEAGLIRGFQWLDGSFLENVEVSESRAPKDIDVVTFFRLPPGQTQLAVSLTAPALFPNDPAGHIALKQRFSVDSYLICLDVAAERLVERSTYWYSVWSHRRNLAWKGYVQIDLAPTPDESTGRLDLTSIAGADE